MRIRLRILLVPLIAAILVGIWFCSPRSRLRREDSVIERPVPGAPAASRPGAAAPAPLGHPVGEEPSHLADDLNSPKGDIHADLRILNEIFRQYRSSLHETNPVGENVEITRVLTGRNKLEFAFIPRDHPAINARGELCDRWGTAFFFHQLSGTQMEIHSAGPDRVMWTDDDVVLTPGLYLPQR